MVSRPESGHGPGAASGGESAVADAELAQRAWRIALLEREVLALLAENQPVERALDELARGLERIAAPGTLASILIVDDEGALRHGAAPNLPPAYVASIEGASIGPAVGSCGTAAWERATVIVTDIENDPRWADYRGAALEHGLRACWSMPILSIEGVVLGTFAFYYRDCRAPRDEDLAAIEGAARLARIVLERERADRARARAEAERERLIAELRDTVRFSELLAAILAHDLRNPLATIVVGTQILQASQLDERARAALEHMSASETRMSRMIDQLLDLTRSRSGGGLAVTRAIFDLGALARSIASELAVAHPHRVVAVEVEGDAGGHWDQDRLGQVLSNLIGNAIEHGDAATPVHVAVDGTEAATVTLSTHNAGTIQAEHLTSLFDPFRRATEASGGTGLGLGLHITRLIAEAHGGSVSVASGEEGTTFRVRLPRAADAPKKPGSG